jgi:hypothetical protein
MFAYNYQPITASINIETEIVDLNKQRRMEKSVKNLLVSTITGLTEENFDSLFHCYLHVRRQFINPTYNNCIKKTFAVKVDKGEPQIHSIYYVVHRGNVCMHDREMIMRQLSDIDHNFYYFKKDKQKFMEIIMNDTCKIEKKF